MKLFVLVISILMLIRTGVILGKFFVPTAEQNGYLVFVALGPLAIAAWGIAILCGWIE